jgi:opacity protein-like surface antigen
MSTSSIQIGLIAGFGFEYALTEHLSIGAEYEYTRLGDRSFTPVGADAMLDWHTASARLNLSF